MNDEGIRASLSQGVTLVTFLQVSQISVFVAVQDVNDNPPIFPFTIKKYNVTEVSLVEPELVPSECGGGRRRAGYLGNTIRELYMRKPQNG